MENSSDILFLKHKKGLSQNPFGIPRIFFISMESAGYYITLHQDGRDNTICSWNYGSSRHINMQNFEPFIEWWLLNRIQFNSDNRDKELIRIYLKSLIK